MLLSTAALVVPVEPIIADELKEIILQINNFIELCLKCKYNYLRVSFLC